MKRRATTATQDLRVPLVDNREMRSPLLFQVQGKSRSRVCVLPDRYRLHSSTRPRGWHCDARGGERRHGSTRT
jgi:hypothetical protein